MRAAIRLAIGVALIAFLVSRSDISAIGRTVAGARPLLIATAYLLNIGLFITSAFRWRVFLNALGIELSSGTTVKLTLVGSFFNAFLPTGIGGDAYKAVRVRKAKSSLAVGLASVLLDRLAGITVLAVIVLATMIPAVLIADTNVFVLVDLFLSIGIIILTTSLLFLGERLLGRGDRTWFGVRPRLRRVLDSAARAVRRPGAIRRALLFSLASQVVAIAVYVSLAWSLDLRIPLLVVILGVFTATIAAAIPVTVNGLGIREAVWVWSLGLYGVGRSEALAYALLVLGIALSTSAVGGVIYAITDSASVTRVGQRP